MKAMGASTYLPANYMDLAQVYSRQGDQAAAAGGRADSPGLGEKNQDPRQEATAQDLLNRL